MSATHPWGWWCLLLALPLLAAYLHITRRSRLVVSSLTLFTTLSGPPFQRRSILVNLHDWKPLLVQTTALLFVTIALVDGRSPATRPQHTVYVIDTSASMGAYESSTHTRLMLAARWIRQAMQGMQPDDRVALVEGGAAARLLVGWTRDPRSLHRALATLEPGGGSSEMPQALRIASVLSHEHRGSIVLLSDGLGFEVPPLDPLIQWQPIGRDPANTGIVELTAERLDAFGSTRLEVTLHHAGPATEGLNVELWAGSQLVAVIVAEVAPYRTATSHRIVQLGRDAVRLEARLHAESIVQRGGYDAFPDDNVAHVDLSAMPSLAALLVGPQIATAWHRALALHPALVLEVHTAETLRTGCAARPVGCTYDLAVAPDVDLQALPVRATHIVAPVPRERPAETVANLVESLVRPLERVTSASADERRQERVLPPPASMPGTVLADAPPRPRAFSTTLWPYLALLAAVALTVDHLRPWGPAIRVRLQQRGRAWTQAIGERWFSAKGATRRMLAWLRGAR